MKSTIVLIFTCLLCLSSELKAQEMNNKQLEEVFSAVADSIIGDAGFWEIYLADRILICVTDESNNRMRIISPIEATESLSISQIEACMEANFHTALDVKYAFSDGILWSAFIHPLKELSDSQVLDGLRQVYNAAATFGTTYSSTDLVFPKREEVPKPDSKDQSPSKEKKT